MYIFVKVSYRE